MNPPIKTLKPLYLVLTHHWYDLTESGQKRIEYREMTQNWKTKIWDKRHTLTKVKFARGYTSRTIQFNIIKIDIGHSPIVGRNGTYYRIHFK